MSSQSDDSRTAAAGWPVWCRRVDNGITLAVHVQPGARRDAVVGVHGERLKIAVRAPAIDGRANQALLVLLAGALALPRRALHMVSGDGGRDKRVLIESATPGPVIDALRALAESHEH